MRSAIKLSVQATDDCGATLNLCGRIPLYNLDLVLLFYPCIVIIQNNGSR